MSCVFPCEARSDTEIVSSVKRGSTWGVMMSWYGSVVALWMWKSKPVLKRLQSKTSAELALAPTQHQLQVGRKLVSEAQKAPVLQNVVCIVLHCSLQMISFCCSSDTLKAEPLSNSCIVVFSVTDSCFTGNLVVSWHLYTSLCWLIWR